MENIAKAIVAVMKAIKGVEKNMSVGAGNSSYKGVSDYDVKKTISAAMEKNGLAILPVEVKAKTEVARWQEESNYGPKQKQSVFTEVETKYLLLHESGESIQLAGYGHGVDTQDKSAGKATTYALKYALLYAFMVPTGKIDDADNEHSDTYAAPPPPVPVEVQSAIAKLPNVKSGDEMKEFAALLTPDVRQHPAFRAAASERQKQYSQPQNMPANESTVA